MKVFCIAFVWVLWFVMFAAMLLGFQYMAVYGPDWLTINNTGPNGANSTLSIIGGAYTILTVALGVFVTEEINKAT